MPCLVTGGERRQQRVWLDRCPVPYQHPLSHSLSSLISSDSAAKTSKSLALKTPFPCTIRGIERAWNKRSIKGMTAMGVQFAEGASCVGVLYQVSEKELGRFDRRERGYRRTEVPIEAVDLIEYLEDDYGEEHRLFLEAVAGKREDVLIWVYVPENPQPPDEEHPIAQTYVDVILQGCLEIHEDFAREFIEDTKGWNPMELLSDNEDSEGDESEDDIDRQSSDSRDNATDDVIAWVNDRDRPIYMRADTEFSQEKGPVVDDLLREHRPEFRRRTRKKHRRRSRAAVSERLC